ncbi:MAG: hypothetical protein ACHQ2E_11470 [Gemmatimonadales bacterium]
MPATLPEPSELNITALLEAFFERSRDGFFFMIIDQPIEWGPGEAGEAAALLGALDSAATDLVLLDVSMPGGPFLETLRALRERHPPADATA